MALKVWRNKGWYYKYKDHNIFYLDEGRGEVIVLIHGFPTASWDWHKLWPSLTSRFHVVTLDMMGFGFSDKPLKYKYTIHNQASLFETILVDLGVKDVHILAHDYGDTVAQELMARYIDRKGTGQEGLNIHSLCLLNGGLFPETHRPLRIQKLLKKPIGRFLVPFMGKSRFRKSFEAIFGQNTQLSQNELDECWDLLTHRSGKRMLPRLIRYMDERVKYRERWLGALQKAGIPLRLIAGEADPVSGKEMVNRYNELIPHPDIILLKDIGHYPHIEAPDLVLKHYFQFVNPDREARLSKESLC